MESLRTSLAPLTNWLPPSLRDLMPVEGWWAVLGGGGLLALIVLWLLLRALGRALFGSRRAPSRDGEEAVEDLAEYPPPPPARAGRRACGDARRAGRGSGGARRREPAMVGERPALRRPVPVRRGSVAGARQ